MSQNLTDAECAELARLVHQAIDGDRYPLAPRVRRWKELLAKLDSSATPPVPYPPPKPWVNSTIGQRKRGRR